MNLRQLHKNFLSLRRFQEIAYTLARHGFTDLLNLVGLSQALGALNKVGLSRKSQQIPRARRLRMVFEELGPTFIKLGQILSTRPDILPANYALELKTLQEQVQPISEQVIKKILLDFYQVSDLHEIFSFFDFLPLGCASISQVHCATLKSGEEVIVKIQRPGLKEIVEADLEILSHIVKLIQEQFGDPEGPADWSAFLEEFIENILKEMDFEREARLMLRFESIFSDQKDVKVPKVYLLLSGRTVLVQERIYGHRVEKVMEDGLFSPVIREKLARTFVNCFFRQVFREGVFHGDPHPGNLRILEDGTLVFLDFGMVGQLSSELMTQMTRMFWGAGREDFELIARSMNRICQNTVVGTPRSLVVELRDLVQVYRFLDMEKLSISEILRAIDGILKRNHLRLPPQLSLLFKALATLEQISRELGPEINLMDFLLPEIDIMVRSRLKISGVKGFIEENTFLLYDYFQELPEDIFQIVKNVKKLQQENIIAAQRSEVWFITLIRVFHRAILGLIVASTMIASSLLIAFSSESQTLYFLGISGFLLGGCFSLMLAYMILFGSVHSD